MRDTLSWRTTLAGAAALACGMILMLRAHDPEQRTIGGGLIATGVGLIAAKDQSTTK